MEVIDIFVEYASGLTITDRAMYVSELAEVCVSERLASILREFAMTEAPPKVRTTIQGQSIALDQGVSGNFTVPQGAIKPIPKSALWLRMLQAFVPQSKEQRQQCGRLMHTLSAASLIGAIGFWHSTTSWSGANILSEVNLLLAFVITYYAGMVSMKGE